MIEAVQPFTLALVVVNVLVFVLSLATGWQALAPFALWPLSSGHFAPWQVFTHAFIHVTPGHLLFNMWGLWLFGRELEHAWGPRRLAVFYLASVLGAAATQLLVSAPLGLVMPTIGASGGLFGLLVGFAATYPRERIWLMLPPVRLPAWLFVSLYGLVELVLGVTGTMNGVAHFAHLGGLLGGGLMMLLWPAPSRPAEAPR